MSTVMRRWLLLTLLTRYGELGQLAGAGTSDRFPPLRELILRRLRGRGDTPQQDQEEGQPSAHAQESRESRSVAG